MRLTPTEVKEAVATKNVITLKSGTAIADEGEMVKVTHLERPPITLDELLRDSEEEYEDSNS